ncbi:hypothetical protein EPN87_03665 [archaeon]|nr:MAG: hypothetical protein EPN87_03665 [archaeon]
MKHLNNWHFVLLLLPIIFLAGCVGQPKGVIIGGGSGGGGVVIVPPSQPFFKTVSIEKDYLSGAESTKINFMVSNPAQISLSGKVEFSYDSSCMNIMPASKDINVPNGNDMPFSVIVQIPTYAIPSSCIGTRDIGMTLRNVDGNNLDFKAVQLNIVKQ